MWEFSPSKSDRLDRLLRKQSVSPWISRHAWEALLEGGRVRVNGRVVKKAGEVVAEGSAVAVDLPRLGLHPGERPAVLVWRSADGSLGVFNKEAGMPSYPLLPWETSTLANGIARFVEENRLMTAEAYALLADPPVLEGGLLQRLDTHTSGLLATAFTREAKAKYREVFSGSVLKAYLAIVEGSISPQKGAVYFSASSGEKVSASRAQKADGTPVELQLEPLSRNAGHSLVRVRTSQGLRHVVRAGMAALGHPLVGDALYGGSTAAAAHHQLHADSLQIPGFSLISSSPPESFLAVLEKLGLDYPV